MVKSILNNELRAGKRNALLIYILVIVIVGASMGAYIFLASHQEKGQRKKYVSASELLWSDEAQSLEFPPQKTIYLRDIVVSVHTYKLPEIYIPFGEIVNETTVRVNATIENAYTAVVFESDPEPLIFLGEKKQNFPINQEVFLSLPAKKYYTSEFGDRYLVEPIYGRVKLIEYGMVIIGGFFSPIKFSQNFSENDTQYILKITNVTNFFPLPLYWGEVNVTFYRAGSGLQTPSPPKIYIYTPQGDLVGTLGKKKNISWNKLVESGQNLKFRYLSKYKDGELRFIYVGPRGDEWIFCVVKLP